MSVTVSPVVQSVTVAPVVQTVSVTSGAVTLAGDCTGANGANTVVAIRGQTIQSGTPAMGSFLRYSGTLWSNVYISEWVKTSYYSTRHTDHTLSNVSTVQNAFHGSNDTLPLDANSVWMFEGCYIIATGTTTHTTAISFSDVGNTGICHFVTMTSSNGAYGTVSRTQDFTIFNSSGGGATNSTTGSALIMVNFNGRITVDTACNFVPQLTFSAAPGGTNLLKSGSWIKLTRLWTGESVFADPEWT
jgi:hypothetical protein